MRSLALFYHYQKATAGPARAPTHPVMGLAVAIRGGLYNAVGSLVEHMMDVGQPEH